MLLDRQGFGESAWLSDSTQLAITRAKAKGRFPILCLDACEKGCARRWLANEAVVPQDCFVLSEAERSDVDRAARRIAAGEV
jgi:uncharacterized metal-binding protein